MLHLFAESIPHFLDRYGLLAIFAVMLVKEIGVPLPIPGDLIMLSAAARSASGQLVLWQAFLAILVALVVGDWIQFALARSLGRPVLDRFGRYIGLTPARLDRASAGVGKGGVVGVAVAIITPGVRNVTVPACGLARLPDRAFLPGLIVGSSVFLALHFLIGYLGGPVVRGALAAVGVPVLALLLALLGIGLVGWLLIRRRAVGHGTDAATATLEGARDWADACCPVCLALGAAHALRQESRITET